MNAFQPSPRSPRFYPRSSRALCSRILRPASLALALLTLAAPAPALAVQSDPSPDSQELDAQQVLDQHLLQSKAAAALQHLQAEDLLRRDLMGNLDSSLFERLAAAAPAEEIPVVLWLRQSAPFAPSRPDAEAPTTMVAVEELFAQNDARLAEVMQETRQPVIEELSRRGIESTANEWAPVLHARITRQALLELSRWDAIDRIYLDGQFEPLLDVSRVVSGMALAQGAYGANGFGIKVGEIEVGGDVHTGNP